MSTNHLNVPPVGPRYPVPCRFRNPYINMGFADVLRGVRAPRRDGTDAELAPSICHGGEIMGDVRELLACLPNDEVARIFTLYPASCRRSTENRRGPAALSREGTSSGGLFSEPRMMGSSAPHPVIGAAVASALPVSTFRNARSRTWRSSTVSSAITFPHFKVMN